MALRLILVSLLACVSADVQTASRLGTEQETYQSAAQSAKKAVQKIWDLHTSVERRARKPLDEKEKEAEQRAESDLGVSRKQLSEHFISLQKDAASQVAKLHLDAAAESLQDMEETDRQLKQLSKRTAWELEDMSREAEDLGRSSARAAEEEVDSLTQEARQQTDSLSRVARKYDLPDLSDRFDRAAGEAARKVQDAAEQGARVTEDAARALPREFERTEHQAELSRRRAIEAMRELISSAEKRKEAPAPALLISSDGNVLALVGLAAAAGAASAVVAAIVMRRSDDEVEDKYLLVV